MGLWNKSIRYLEIETDSNSSVTGMAAEIPVIKTTAIATPVAIGGEREARDKEERRGVVCWSTI